jgi:hypothetical protein
MHGRLAACPTGDVSFPIMRFATQMAPFVTDFSGNAGILIAKRPQPGLE